jgi:formamidopyrimidine-DNA glycosylase
VRVNVRETGDVHCSGGTAVGGAGGAPPSFQTTLWSPPVFTNETASPGLTATFFGVKVSEIVARTVCGAAVAGEGTASSASAASGIRKRARTPITVVRRSRATIPSQTDGPGPVAFLCMPELPEVEITARRIGAAVAGATIESALAPGINVLKTFDPPLGALEGRAVEGVRRRGKHLIVDASGGLSVLVHLMSAGRLQLFDKRAGPRDRTSRLLLALEDGRELRLREFGTKQRAWAKVLEAAAVEEDDAIATLGPEAWPDPPPFEELLVAPRPLHSLLRDQHVIAGIGRSWVDEILWTAQLSPFKRGDDLVPLEAARLRDAAVQCLGAALDHYEHVIELPIPDKLPMPLQVHRRQGEPCPRCGTTLEAVHYEDYVMTYCPACQTEGRVLKDRRLSRLLK